MSKESQWIELEPFLREESDFDHFANRENYNKWLGSIFCNGRKYRVPGVESLQGIGFRYGTDAIAHAIKQVVQIQEPARKFIQVDVSCQNKTEDEIASEWQACVWWNHRKGYEELHFRLAY